MVDDVVVVSVVAVARLLCRRSVQTAALMFPGSMYVLSVDVMLAEPTAQRLHELF